MIETTPKVYLISEPTIVLDQMYEYLGEVGGAEWYERVVAPMILAFGRAGASPLVEFCGRLCYRSWKPGLNRNVTKIREDSAEYLLNVLTQRHGSVIEHAHFTFALRDVSRVFTAEHNRHRLANISEQSLRYVRLDELRFRVPEILRPETQKRMRALVKHCEKAMAAMIEMEGLDDPALDFGRKKLITSALRRGVPMGISTEEAWTANLRTIRHVIESRTSFGAEEEIRIVANQIANIMAERAPFFFADYEQVRQADDPVPAWQTPYSKV